MLHGAAGGDDDDFAHLAVQQGDISADSAEEQNQAGDEDSAIAEQASEQAQADVKPRKTASHTCSGVKVKKFGECSAVVVLFRRREKAMQHIRMLKQQQQR